MYEREEKIKTGEATVENNWGGGWGPLHYPRSRHTNYPPGFRLLRGYDIVPQMIYSIHHSSCMAKVNYLPSNPKGPRALSNLIYPAEHKEHDIQSKEQQGWN